MTYVPANTFVNSVVLPSGAPITSDPYEFSGQSLQFVSAQCPVPFGSGTGASNCPALCINTCPELNPSTTLMKQQQLAADQLLLPYVAAAINASQTALGLQSDLVNVSGSVSFGIPSGTTSGVLSQVTKLMQQQLPLIAPFTTTLTVCHV